MQSSGERLAGRAESLGFRHEEKVKVERQTLESECINVKNSVRNIHVFQNVLLRMNE